MTDCIIASGDARPIPPKRVDRSVVLSRTEDRDPLLDGLSPVFGLNAKYFVEPGSSAADVNSDSACFYEALEEVHQALLTQIEQVVEGEMAARQLTGLVFGAIYLSRLAAGMSAAAGVLAHREKTVAGDAQ
jgi:hypothetical protein